MSPLTLDPTLATMKSGPGDHHTSSIPISTLPSRIRAMVADPVLRAEFFETNELIAHPPAQVTDQVRSIGERLYGNYTEYVPNEGLVKRDEFPRLAKVSLSTCVGLGVCVYLSSGELTMKIAVSVSPSANLIEADVSISFVILNFDHPSATSASTSMHALFLSLCTNRTQKHGHLRTMCTLRRKQAMMLCCKKKRAWSLILIFEG